MDSNKILNGLGGIAAALGLMLALYLWTTQAFTLPLGLLSIVLLLLALWFQGQSHS